MKKTEFRLNLDFFLVFINVEVAKVKVKWQLVLSQSLLHIIHDPSFCPEFHL